MRRNRWHILEEGEMVSLARRLPMRWDVSAETDFPDLRRVRLAHQIRQDLRRVLRRQRGFSPQIGVRRCGNGLHLRVGGRIDGHHNTGWIERQIAALLSDRAARARWIACATRQQRRDV